jgi:hypothetical protein
MIQRNWAHAIAMQCGVVPLSFGPPGVGKTAFHRALAKASGRHFIQMILRQRTPEDIGGIPVVQRSDGLTYVEYVQSAEMQLCNNAPSLLLLDEFNHAPADVLGAAQEMVNNPPANCWMAACANPLSQATDGHELPPAVVNRMVILDWEADDSTVFDAWQSGLSGFCEPLVPIVPADYMATAGAWGTAAFNAKHALDLGVVPNQGDEPVPFASLRSVTNCIRLMAACDAVGADPQVRIKMGNGCIGAKAFDRLCSAYDALTADGSIHDPQGWIVPIDFMQQRAAIQAAIAQVRHDSSLWTNARIMVGRLYDKAPEVAVQAYKVLLGMRPDSAVPVRDELSRHIAEVM